MHLNWPLTMMARRVQSASHSSILCDVRMTDRPSLMTAVILSQTKRRVPGSIPVVGSSCRPQIINFNRAEIQNRMYHAGQEKSECDVLCKVKDLVGNTEFNGEFPPNNSPARLVQDHQQAPGLWRVCACCLHCRCAQYS